LTQVTLRNRQVHFLYSANGNAGGGIVDRVLLEYEPRFLSTGAKEFTRRQNKTTAYPTGASTFTVEHPEDLYPDVPVEEVLYTHESDYTRTNFHNAGGSATLISGPTVRASFNIPPKSVLNGLDHLDIGYLIHAYNDPSVDFSQPPVMLNLAAYQIDYSDNAFIGSDVGTSFSIQAPIPWGWNWQWQTNYNATWFTPTTLYNSDGSLAFNSNWRVEERNKPSLTLTLRCFWKMNPTVFCPVRSMTVS